MKQTYTKSGSIDRRQQKSYLAIFGRFPQAFFRTFCYLNKNFVILRHIDRAKNDDIIKVKHEFGNVPKNYQVMVSSLGVLDYLFVKKGILTYRFW